MLPAPAVGHVERIVNAVRSRQERLGPVEVAEEPVFLEPADVAHLPDRRLEEVSVASEHVRIREPSQWRP
jgi:hypothetical protein